MTPGSSPSTFQIVAYFPEWETRRPYTIKDMVKTGSAAKITVINYAFGAPGPDPATGQIVARFRDAAEAYQRVYSAEMSVDGAADDPTQPLRGHFNQIKKLKARFPHIRVVVSMGGWTDSTWFSDAARTPASRQSFVSSCIDTYIRGDLPLQNGAGGKGTAAGVFDGIDLDWEFPVRGGYEDIHHDPADGENYVLLVQEFRRQFEAIGRPDLLLTMAGPASASEADHYNLREAHPSLDFISIMTYDFHGAWSSRTNHHTNLYSSPADPEASHSSADQSVKLYRDTYGIPASKLVLGAAFYGRAWKEVGEENHGLYQPGTGVEGGDGSTNYYTMQARLEHGYTRYWDDAAQAPWLYNPAERIFWTYDDPQSIALKARYARQHGLAGVMFWEVSGDDANGTLVETIYKELT